ncbi:DddA-like double-stranded DNA deaminase toxin [Kribbella sp. NPDC000426]|uniref:DddA-like double-stranded DNA deaminase toxin n=1 Tax=Kribbella sp. NPDC000426 TaxID=3154255 RepID=UPI00332BD8DB
MPSELQRVAEQLLGCLNESARAVSYLHDRARKSREAAAWIGGTSNNPSARMAAMQLDQAARRCEEAAHYLSQADSRARAWVEQMVSGIRTTEPSGGPAGRRSPSPADGTPRSDRQKEGKQDREASTTDKLTGVGDETIPRAPSRPSSSEPDRFEPVARGILERVPVRKLGDKTHGKWINAADEEEDLVSGYDNDSADVKRFMEEHNIRIAPGPDTLGSHVEVKFAMRMRRDGLTDETIMINNRPCPGPYGCHRNLWKFLPDGARLTVYGPDGFKRTYPE